MDGLGDGDVVAGQLSHQLVVCVLLGIVVYWDSRQLESIGLRPSGRGEVVVGTAAVTEEVLWRGYPIERLTELTGRLWVGAGVSGFVFFALHYPAWGVVGAIPQAVFTLVLLSVYVRSRNAVACMLTHGVINVSMILVLPAFL